MFYDEYYDTILDKVRNEHVRGMSHPALILEQKIEEKRLCGYSKVCQKPI